MHIFLLSIIVDTIFLNSSWSNNSESNEMLFMFPNMNPSWCEYGHIYITPFWSRLTAFPKQELFMHSFSMQIPNRLLIWSLNGLKSIPVVSVSHSSKTCLKYPYNIDYLDICLISNLSIFMNIVLYMIYIFAVFGVLFYQIF